MNILVTNDDGIYSNGIKALVSALSEKGTVYVCAPESQKSACGHGITVSTPVMVNEVNSIEGVKKAWKISGTPADCVKLGVSVLAKEKIDFVFSGINHGANLGTDVLYSGTVSGAVEGILLGIPSAAVSLDALRPSSDDFEAAKKITSEVFDQMCHKELEPDTLLNINIPFIPAEEIKGVRITRLGVREYDENFQARKTPFGNDYYWYGGKPVQNDQMEEDIDVRAVQEGFISITPIHYDLTNYKIIDEVKKWGIRFHK